MKVFLGKKKKPESILQYFAIDFLEEAPLYRKVTQKIANRKVYSEFP